AGAASMRDSVSNPSKPGNSDDLVMSGTQLRQSLCRLEPSCFNGPLRKTIGEDGPNFPGETKAQRPLAISATAARHPCFLQRALTPS
ncbi:hypothetical protein, partial [Bradyrhizobium sp.]|uniref:hypothetical protein n=1 Tax=Bradyrhizobium sp. TaxID=376 RepID=UPI002911CD88